MNNTGLLLERGYDGKNYIETSKMSEILSKEFMIPFGLVGI